MSAGATRGEITVVTGEVKGGVIGGAGGGVTGGVERRHYWRGDCRRDRRRALTPPLSPPVTPALSSSGIACSRPDEGALLTTMMGVLCFSFIALAPRREGLRACWCAPEVVGSLTTTLGSSSSSTSRGVPLAGQFVAPQMWSVPSQFRHRFLSSFDVSLSSAGDVGAPVVGAVVGPEAVLASSLVPAKSCEVQR